jgi:IclR family transcriptional regulator, acetate operon repressor
MGKAAVIASEAPESGTGAALRALHVLEQLAGMEQPAGLPAIVGRTQLSKSKAYRALRALQDAGFVDHVGHGGYRLGTRSAALASLIGSRPAVVQAARPVLVQLANLASAGAALHLRSGDHRVLVLGVVSAKAPADATVPRVPVGERAPLTSGCGGTAILAYLPPAEADSVIRARQRREPRPSRASLARIRAAGYAVSFSANHPGLNGIGAPLLDPIDAFPLGSIAIAGRDEQLPEDALHRLSDPLIAACARLAPRLAKVLGPNSSERRATLDVTIQDAHRGGA